MTPYKYIRHVRAHGELRYYLIKAAGRKIEQGQTVRMLQIATFWDIYSYIYIL